MQKPPVAKGTSLIERWLSEYVAAWSTDDPAAIAALFTEDARYYTAPYRQPLVGRDAIADWWVAEGESSLRWTFVHEVVAENGNLFVVRGTTTYLGRPETAGRAEIYHNLWLVTVDKDGRASEFVEYWMLQE